MAAGVEGKMRVLPASGFIRFRSRMTRGSRLPPQAQRPMRFGAVHGEAFPGFIVWFGGVCAYHTMRTAWTVGQKAVEEAIAAGKAEGLAENQAHKEGFDSGFEAGSADMTARKPEASQNELIVRASPLGAKRGYTAKKAARFFQGYLEGYRKAYKAATEERI